MIIPSNLFIVVDILVIATFLLCVIKGYKNGFIYELINVLFLIISFVAAWLVSPILAKKVPLISLDSSNELNNKIIDSFNIDITLNSIIWFIVIVLLINLIYFLIRPLFKTISKIPVIGTINKFLGAILGAVRAFIITLLISILLTLPVIDNGVEVKNNTLFKYIETVSNYSTKFIVNNINFDNLKNEFDNIDVDAARDELLQWLIKQGILNE